MSNLLTAIRARDLHRLQASALIAALEATGGRLPSTPRSAAGDSARLRGIPMIGGTGGHIPGTRPGDGLHVSRMDRRGTL